MSDSGNDAVVSFSSALAAGMLATLANNAPLSIGILSAAIAGIGGYIGSRVYHHATAPPSAQAQEQPSSAYLAGSSPQRSRGKAITLLLVVAVAVAALVIMLNTTAVAPFIYTLF
jgi:hypothetical protein